MELTDYVESSNVVQEWFGASNPTFMLIVLAIYLLLILKILPNYMKNRPAYQLKTFISIYNITQVVACIYIVQQILYIATGQIFKFWKCNMFEPNTRAEYLFYRISYFTFWLKIVELTETAVFVLRKKQNQVSFLHVFHHCTTVTLIYVMMNFYRGGSSLYPILLNSNVHIIMYSYYLAAAVCDKAVLRRLRPIKQSITIIQMIQFVLILVQAGTTFYGCVISPYVIWYYSLVVSVMFYGFYDFYKNSYK